MSDAMQYSTYELKCRNAHDKNFLSNAPEEFRRLYLEARETTMLSRERLFDLYASVKHVIQHDIPGDIVEVGCWGGGALAIALAVVQASNSKKSVWGYDTFEGHPEPNPDEFDVWGNSQLERFNELKAQGDDWCKVSLEEVGQNVQRICQSSDGLKLIKGKAEETLKRQLPEVVSIIRCDVDWYEPSLATFEILYPRLSPGGIVIVDDYGHHTGSRKAIDQYFGDLHPKFTHIDYSCITFVKP
jgi:O-methyltransferase